MYESLGFAAMFGGLGIVLAAAGVIIFDVIDFRVNHADEIKKGNMSAAVVVSAYILGICYIIGRTVGGYPSIKPLLSACLSRRRLVK